MEGGEQTTTLTGFLTNDYKIAPYRQYVVENE